MTFIEFFQAQWMLFAGVAVVIVLIVMNEVKTIRNRVFLISRTKAIQMTNNDDAIFVDIRDQDVFNKGHIPGAVHEAVENLEARLVSSSRYKDKTIILYCDSGSNSLTQTEKLRAALPDLQIFSLQGGVNDWLQANLPVESSKK